MKILKDQRKLWKTVNPLFSEKSYSKESISPINKDGLITKKEDLTKTFKGAVSDLIQLLAIESSLKMMKNAFYFI